MLQRICRWTAQIRPRSFRRTRAPLLERIFLHIGVEKTGTTTLQVTMAINRRLLRRFGYAVPAAPKGFPSCHFGLALCAAHPDAVPELRQAARLASGKAYEAFIESYPEKISRELVTSGCHTGSCPMNTAAPVSPIQQRFKKSIKSLRDWAASAASKYTCGARRTRCKSLFNGGEIGGTREFDFNHAVPWLNYLHLLEMWTQVFGK